MEWTPGRAWGQGGGLGSGLTEWGNAATFKEVLGTRPNSHPVEILARSLVLGFPSGLPVLHSF